MALDTFNPYLFVSSGEQSNKFLTPKYADGIASFQAQRAQDLTGLTIRIDPIQEGTGDPSPDNIRPISGRTGLTVTVQSGDTQNTYPISWQTDAGTIYGGTLDVVSGVLTVTHGYILLDGTQSFALTNWRETANGVGWIYPMTLTQNYVERRDINVPDIICDRLPTINYATAYTGSVGYGISALSVKSGITSYGLVVRCADASLTTAAAINAYLAENPLQIAYKLATPQTYQLTPTEVRTIAGYNQVYSDAGPVIDIKF